MQSFWIAFTLFPKWFHIIIMSIGGAIFGSFFNVCISRWPKGESVIWKRSHCMRCGHLIPWYHNLPLISYCLLKGRCPYCNEKFSSRYFWVEFLTALIFTAISLYLPSEVWVPACIFASLGLIASVVDLETFTIPDMVLLWGAFLGLVLAFFFPDSLGGGHGLQNLVNSLRNGVLATGAFLWFGFIFESILKKPAFGIGDAFLIGVLAIFTGPWGALFAVFGGAILGTMFMAIAFLLEKFWGIVIGPRASLEDLMKMDSLEDIDSAQTPVRMGIAIPFGPWLSLASLMYFFFLQPYENEIFKYFFL